jgi:hypothetical protein
MAGGYNMVVADFRLRSVPLPLMYYGIILVLCSTVFTFAAAVLCEISIPHSYFAVPAPAPGADLHYTALTGCGTVHRTAGGK